MRALALSLAISLFVIGLNPMDASARGKKKSRIAQLEARIAANRNSACGVCSSDLSSAALPLQRLRSRMS